MRIFFTVRFSAMGWGNPPVPESPQEIPEFLRSLNKTYAFEDWVYDLIGVLIECESWSSFTAKTRTFSIDKLDICAHARLGIF